MARGGLCAGPNSNGVARMCVVVASTVHSVDVCSMGSF